MSKLHIAFGIFTLIVCVVGIYRGLSAFHGPIKLPTNRKVGLWFVMSMRFGEFSVALAPWLIATLVLTWIGSYIK